jgi:hypothetical protein
MKKSILLLIPIFLFSQIERNMAFERKMMIHKYEWNNSYSRNNSDFLTEDELKDTNNFIRFGVQADAFMQNSSIDYSWNYNDKFNYTVVPLIYGRGTKNLTFYVNFMAQNAKTDIIDSRKSYLGETQKGHWLDFEISKIQYETKHFYVKFGRDYFMPGMNFYESMLFSHYQYPYDQIHFAYRNKFLELSSYYLRLNDMWDSGTRYQRHLNGHRLSFNLFDKGYIAFNEIILHTGEQRPINLALFNPLLVYYIYQRNENIESTNSLLSTDFFYTLGKVFIHGEFIIDDIMVEREVYSDLEPLKYGLNLTLGIKDILPGFHWNINHTRIANRVYSTLNPRINVERFIHENLPIGYYMGSNLWELKSTLSYIKTKYQGELQFIYRVTGDDVLYSPYNIDHFQGHVRSDPLEPGAEWNEAFPYVSDGGDPAVFWGIKLNNYYQLLNYFGLNLKASYWFEKGMLSSNFNIAGGVYLNL